MAWDLQSLDALQLLRRRLIRNRAVPHLYYSFVQSFVTAVSVVALLARVVSLNDYSLRFCSNITGPPELSMERGGDVLQQRIQGNFQGGFRIDSFGMLSTARARQIFALVSYLFTFCPPGPEDLLKLNSPMFLRGIDSACSFASQVRAAWSSSSLALPPPCCEDENGRCTTWL